ncbi:glycine oxidase ThiO [Marinicrinis lubricantis]|uniref:glycine oxidase n=1 Tax=Marinicrinis lubricantis TaxID=2086470 RepID=A0ABW1IP47_9BACL
MTHHVNTIIIGGGVIGCSIAFELAKRGKKVAVLERGRLAGEASGAAAGMLAAQAEMEKSGPLFELARRSRSMFPALAEELRELSGIDIALVRKGMLKVAMTADEALSLKHIMEFQRKSGERAEWLSGTEVRAREPGLSEAVIGAMWIPEDGHVLAPELTQALAVSAGVLGADLMEFTDVRSLVLENGRAAGVVTQHGLIGCDQLVIASGARAGELLDQAGSPLPIYPVKGECVSVISRPPLLTSTIFSHGCYLVPKRGGRIVIGATSTEHCYDKRVTASGVAVLLDRAKRLVPNIVNAEWEKAWTGLRPQTEDGLPYIGEHPDWKGLFVAAGHYRNGILLSPVTGKLVADLMEGKSWDIPMEAFRLNRNHGERKQAEVVW